MKKDGKYTPYIIATACCAVKAADALIKGSTAQEAMIQGIMAFAIGYLVYYAVDKAMNKGVKNEKTGIYKDTKKDVRRKN